MNGLTLIALTLLGANTNKVDTVVVYPDRAQVTRTAEVTCSGRTTLTFEGIPPAADPATLRALATNATVEGLRSEKRTRDALYSKELEDIDRELRLAQRELEALGHQERQLSATRELGTHFENVAVAMISRDMAVSKPDTKSWAHAFDASMGARLKAASQLATLNAKVRSVSYRIDDLRRRQSRLSAAAQRTDYLAEVLVSCAAGRTARVELTYLVGGASWTPRYEARSAEPGAVELSTFATVLQRTGEDWKDARIILSTAIPSQDATPPELQRLEVYAEKREAEKKVLVPREEAIEHARVGFGGEEEAAGNVTAAAQGLSVQLQVKDRSDVPGNGESVRLFVGKHRLPAKFAWKTAPTLAPFVFRVADATNTAPYPLLAGELDAFGRQGFVGRFPLERTAQGAPLQLTFGLEDAVKVKRTVVEEVKRDSGLFNQRKRFRYAYRFEIANFADKALEIEIADRIPLSELDDVVVELSDKTTRGFEHHAQDGVVTWRLKLSPHEKKTVDLAFHLDVPQSYDTDALGR